MGIQDLMNQHSSYVTHWVSYRFQDNYGSTGYFNFFSEDHNSEQSDNYSDSTDQYFVNYGTKDNPHQSHSNSNRWQFDHFGETVSYANNESFWVRNSRTYNDNQFLRVGNVYTTHLIFFVRVTEYADNNNADGDSVVVMLYSEV